ncbi:NADP oxidoreductase [Spirochaetia bacterium]|nr:NADP oxidoreductase [Spirochaetia bacterium]GHV93364.1 NADP oxidoreductase [Spirochaetia bacterium]
MAKMTLEELRSLRDSKKNDLRKRDAEGKEIQVIVGMGTCGIAAGAKVTLDAFINALDAAKLVDSVLVRQTGCMGLCHSEPTVEVIVPGMPAVIYGNVDAGVAKDIVKKHLIGKELLDNKILDRPAADINRLKG